MSQSVVLVVQLVASSAMAAIAWFVQQVHYPLFARLGDAPRAGEGGVASPADRLAAFHDENVRRTRPVVLVPMAVEALSATWLAAHPPPGIGRPAAIAGLALVVMAVLSTLLIQVPLHERLRSGDDSPETVERLVRSTRLRTAAWSARTALAAWMIAAFAGDR